MQLFDCKAECEVYPWFSLRPNNTPLLGATTLEIFRLVADPVNEQLIPAPRIRARFF